MHKDNPAMPFHSPDSGSHYGLTTREYFAIQAMSGILAAPDTLTVPLDAIARDAVKLADHLITELNKDI